MIAKQPFHPLSTHLRRPREVFPAVTGIGTMGGWCTATFFTNAQTTIPLCAVSMCSKGVQSPAHNTQMMFQGRESLDSISGFYLQLPSKKVLSLRCYRRRHRRSLGPIHQRKSRFLLLLFLLCGNDEHRTRRPGLTKKETKFTMHPLHKSEERAVYGRHTNL